MKLLLKIILLIIAINNIICIQASIIPVEIYISNIRGSDTNQCGNSTSNPCQSIQGSIQSLVGQYKPSSFYPSWYYPTSYQFTFYLEPSTYQPPPTTIDLQGYKATFEPYPNSNTSVYFSGGGDTWFTASSLAMGMTLVFSNINTIDCSVSTAVANGYNSFFFGTNFYDVISGNQVSISFLNCSFQCPHVTVPLISVSNQTVIYDYSNAPSFSVNLINCTFGTKYANSTLNVPYFNIESPVSLSIISSIFINLNSPTNSSLLLVNNGMVSIKNTNYNSILGLFLLKTNNSNVIIDGLKEISYESIYSSGMILLNNTVFSISNLEIDTKFYNPNPISLISLSNSFGTIQASYLNTYDLLFNGVDTSLCGNTFLIGAINSNVYLSENNIDSCGSGLYISSSNIVSNGCNYPYIFTPAMVCNKNTISYFSGTDVNQFNTDDCGPSGSKKVGYIIGIVCLSVVILILILIIIKLFLNQRHHHHQNYRQI